MLGAKPVLPSGRYTSAWAFMAVLVVFIVGTRWPLAPRYPYYFDSGNFALSLEQFNPALHQPQPPGYAFFVGLIRLIHLWVERPERVLLVAGLLAACAATLLIRMLAAELFGRTAGILAAALLASNPVFWFAGVTNQIRLFLSLIAVGIGLLAWRALTRPARPYWFSAACAGLGLAGGFRPEAALLLAPVGLWVWSATGRSPRRLAIGAACFTACSLPWIAVTVMAVGGIHPTVDMLWTYADSQFHGTSAVFGATGRAAYKMFASALVWNLLGAVVWLWAVPFARLRTWNPDLRRQATFLSIAFLPPFLFSAFIHIGDPDQGLASISILCVAGGAVLAAFLHRIGSHRAYAASSAIVLAHALLFFLPPTRLAQASSYRAVLAVDRLTTNAITAIQDLDCDGPVTIVHYASPVSSRHLAYYFPDDYVVVLPANPGEGPLSYYRHESLPVPAEVAGLIRPGSHRLLLVVPGNADPKLLVGWRNHRGIYYLELDPNVPITIGPYRLAPSPVM